MRQGQRDEAIPVKLNPEICTAEEVAAMLSIDEGRRVSVAEIRQIECRALRKLRHLLQRCQLNIGNLVPD